MNAYDHPLDQDTAAWESTSQYQGTHHPEPRLVR
jgi:hypothetical protein